MADNAESSGDAQVTFKVKTSSDGSHTITMPESATVLELKTKLSTAEFENIPVERQRLIYSGRVMKNDDTLATYKIKPNNTIHMVKSAASNPSPSASTSTPTPRAVPSNMAAGTANNPLAGLTGARFAGHAHLPGMDMFGPDGGMGPPMDEERLQSMLSDPNVQQTMNEALSNPDFISMLIDSNPMLRNVPNARELLTSPFMRQMMSNPQMITQAMRMQQRMRAEAFPAPGATNNTPNSAPTQEGATGQANNTPSQNPFTMPGMTGNGPTFAEMMQAMSGMNSSPFGATPGQTASGNQGLGEFQTVQNEMNAQDPQLPGNPFAALFPPLHGSAANHPFGISPEQMQQMMQMFGAPGAAAASPPADTRPPEERYAEQLRQLNDMGFYDFDRNVAALRRSGGSVQGAIEHLLSATD